MPKIKSLQALDSGCGQVVRVLALYSDNPSSNPAEDDNISV